MKLEKRALFAADSEVPIVDWSVVVEMHDVPHGPGRVGEKRLVFGCSMENWHEEWIWNRLAEPRPTCTNDSASTLRTGVQSAAGQSIRFARGIARSELRCECAHIFEELDGRGMGILHG